MERASYFLKLWVPTVIIFLLSDYRGRHNYRCTMTSEVSLKFSKLCAALIKYSWPALCVQFLVCRVDGAFFPPMCNLYVQLCLAWRCEVLLQLSHGTKRDDGWVEGLKVMRMFSHYLMPLSVAGLYHVVLSDLRWHSCRMRGDRGVLGQTVHWNEYIEIDWKGVWVLLSSHKQNSHTNQRDAFELALSLAKRTWISSWIHFLVSISTCWKICLELFRLGNCQVPLCLCSTKWSKRDTMDMFSPDLAPLC